MTFPRCAFFLLLLSAQGVDATALALGADRGGKNIVSRLDYASGEADVLKATFNRERNQYSEERDPEM